MSTNKVTKSFLIKDGIQTVEDRTYLEEKDNVLFIVAESNSIEEAYSLIELKSRSLALILEDDCYEEQEWS